MTRITQSQGLFKMKNRVSSILFALALFNGLASASAESFTEVSATLTYDKELLDGASASQVLASLEEQSLESCRKVSMTSISLVVDEVCANDVLFQAVEQIAHPDLTAAYAESDMYVETVSDRIQLASR